MRMMPVSCGQNAVLGGFHFEFSEGGKWGRVRTLPGFRVSGPGLRGTLLGFRTEGSLAWEYRKALPPTTPKA